MFKTLRLTFESFRVNFR